MRAGYITTGNELLDRADRAIGDAIATRAEVRAGLAEAAMRIPHRVWPKTTLAHPKGPGPLPWDHLAPWCALARAMDCASQLVGKTDAELERAYRKALPSMQTPLALIRE